MPAGAPPGCASNNFRSWDPSPPPPNKEDTPPPCARPAQLSSLVQIVAQRWDYRRQRQVRWPSRPRPGTEVARASAHEIDVPMCHCVQSARSAPPPKPWLQMCEPDRMRGVSALREFLVAHPQALLTPLAVFAVVVAVGYVCRRLLLKALAAWCKRTNSRVGRILIDALRGPLVIWILILAVHLSLQSSALPSRFTQWTVEPLRVLFVLSLTFMCMRFAGDLVRFSGAQISGAPPVTTLTQTLVQLFVLIVGVLIILNQLHLSIPPILTAF